MDPELERDWLSLIERLTPSLAIMHAVEAVLSQTLAPEGYVGVHWRRGDRAHPEMGTMGLQMWELGEPEHMACEINRLIEEFKAASVFVGTNCGTPADKQRLRQLVRSPLVFLSDLSVYGDWQSGLEALVTEMFVLARSAVFLAAGDSHWGSSTVSRLVINMRRGDGGQWRYLSHCNASAHLQPDGTPLPDNGPHPTVQQLQGNGEGTSGRARAAGDVSCSSSNVSLPPPTASTATYVEKEGGGREGDETTLGEEATGGRVAGSGGEAQPTNLSEASASDIADGDECADDVTVLVSEPLRGAPAILARCQGDGARRTGEALGPRIKCKGDGRRLVVEGAVIGMECRMPFRQTDSQAMR